MSEIYTPEPVDMPSYSGKPASGDPSKDWMAIVSLVTGILGLCAWLFWFCGLPVAIIAIVFGILGLKSTKRTLALVGLGLGVLSIILSIVGVIFSIAAAPALQETLNQMM
jgi:hypothetical protein